MAELENRGLYGFNSDEFCEGITMQWHLTVECDQACKHCYMFDDESYLPQKDNRLTDENAYKLVDEFIRLLKGYGIKGSIALTGGDPILSPNFWNVLEYVQNYKDTISLHIMGNPYHINKGVAQRLNELGVKSYQISLDGLEKTHDFIRKPGSFSESMRALKCLHEAGILTAVMFTACNENYTEALELYKFLNNYDFIDLFCCDRMIPIGNAKKKLKSLIDVDAYKKLLYEFYKYEVLNKPRVALSKKDTLWKLFFYDMGLTNPIDKQNHSICNGCVAAVQHFCVLADGTFYACRRLDIPAGKFPEKNLVDIYFNAELFHNIKESKNFDGCSECELLRFCRGCVAMKYAVSENINAKDPNCWRK